MKKVVFILAIVIALSSGLSYAADPTGAASATPKAKKSMHHHKKHKKQSKTASPSAS